MRLSYLRQQYLQYHIVKEANKPFFMKAIFLGVSILCGMTTIAQETISIKKPFYPRKNEIGLMFETNLTSSENLDLVGVQYKHWKNEHFGYRIIAAQRTYESTTRDQYVSIQHDTVFRLGNSNNIKMAFIGAGIEAQRHFFKSVYLFAAVEIRGGYGSGNYNTTLTVEKQNGEYIETANSIKSNGVKMFAIEAVPSVGAKLQYKKLCFGTEAFFVHASYSKITYPITAPVISSGSLLDFSAGELAQRFFINYRF